MNKLRGDFDSIQLAELIMDLKNTHSVTDEELNQFLGYTPDEIKGYESLVNFDFDTLTEELPEDILEDTDLPVLADLTISLTEKQKEVVENLVKIFGVKDISEAIVLTAQYITDLNSDGLIEETRVKTAAGKLVLPIEEQLMPTTSVIDADF